MCPRFLIPALSLALLAPTARAEEGMWLFNQPPSRQLKEKHGFEFPEGWLDHLRLSSVRMGASGSFVSPHGLVLTNHHVGSGTIQRLSTRERDLLKEGFYAATRDEELRCPDREFNVLVSIEDVTAPVNAAVTDGMSKEDAYAARRGAIAVIQQRSFEETGLRSDVVTLHRGGAYHLYRYKRYTDVRLVFAPDKQAAFFGGDPDNFTYPRFNFDLCFFRVYENGKPANTPHFLKWNAKGAADGELVFVSGHPGRTSRSKSFAELETARDLEIPHSLRRLFRLEVAIGSWAARDRENYRRAKGQLFGIQNGRKARRAALNGLLDPEFMRQKLEAENDLRRRLREQENAAEADRAFDRIAAAQEERRTQFLENSLFEGADGFDSDLFHTARTLLRAAVETPKPNGERLEEFQDARRPSLELRLFSPRPIYKDLEEVTLADSLTFLQVMLGPNDPLVRKIMAGKSPRERAHELVQGTRLEEVARRRSLYEGRKNAIAASDDPMIALARLVDARSRAARKRAEPVSETNKQAHQVIAQARFALEGDAVYPDATGTLRLAYGTVCGYREGAVAIPFETTITGLYERNADQGGQPPFHLPEKWAERKSALNLDTPLNFVSTVDITGGNSGSPLVNRRGELVGILFDGNIHSLVNGYRYTDRQARAVSVHTAGMLEGLRKVYQAHALVGELVTE